jgi:5-methyltetrahydrofolate--homocysteine methyltransferase
MAAEVARRYHGASGLPVMAQPNAGQPVLERGEVIYHETPEQMSVGLPALLNAGARIVGGCCGSTPDHIRAFRTIIDARTARR